MGRRFVSGLQFHFFFYRFWRNSALLSISRTWPTVYNFGPFTIQAAQVHISSPGWPFVYPCVRTRERRHRVLDCVWNVMAHAQKPDFVFRRNGRVHLKSAGASIQSTTGSRGVRISGSNAGYTMFRGSVKGTGYTLHSPVSPSLPLRHRVPSHFNWSLLIVIIGCFTNLVRPCITALVKMIQKYVAFYTTACVRSCVRLQSRSLNIYGS